MGTIRKTAGKTARGRLLRTPTVALVLTLLAALLLAGSASAAATPGRPTAKAPKGTVKTTTPTFTWSKAARAVKYELRVYQGSAQKLKKSGLTRLSYKAVKALPTNVTLTWKVRAGNAAGAGAWSRSLEFTVTVVDLKIGDPYQGGIVAYILEAGDRGYVAGETHGLIAATADQTPSSGTWGEGIQWATAPNLSISVSGTSTAIGSGSANTGRIIAQNGAGSTYAAGLARACTDGGYSDWYLPSRDELNELCLNRVAIGGFETVFARWTYYWSSTEYEDYLDYAWGQNFEDGSQFDSSKAGMCRVRAIRSF